MKETLRALRGSFLWAGLAVALGVVCLSFLLKEKDMNPGKTVLFKFPGNDARLLKISFPGSNRPDIEVRYVKKDVWRLAKPLEDEADAYAIPRIVGYMAHMLSLRGWEAGSVEALEMGPPKVRLEVTKRDGSSTWVEIGRKTASGFRVYARVSSKEGVWEISKALWDAVDRPLKEYRNRCLFSVDYLDLASFSVTHGSTGRVTEYKKQGKNEWSIEAPYRGNGDTKAIFAFTYDLDRARVLEFLKDETDLATLGLDKPALTIVFQDEDQKSSRVDFGVVSDEDGKTTWYARSHDRGVIGSVESPDLDRKMDFSDPFRFRERRVFAGVGDRYKVVEVKGFIDDRNVSFRVGKRQMSWIIEEPGLYSVDKRSFEPFLGRLNKLRIEAFLDEKPSPEVLKKYGLAKGGLRVRVTSDPNVGGAPGETSSEVAFGKTAGSGVVYARIDGQGPVVSVPLSFIKELTYGDLEFLNRDLLPHDDETVDVFQARDSEGVVRWERSRGGQIWAITKPEGGGTADKSLMDATLKFGFRKAAKFYARWPYDPAEFGLVEKDRFLTLTFEFRQNNQPVKAVLYISKKGPTSETLYAAYRKGDFPRKGDLVFAVSRSAVDNVLKLMKQAREK